MSSDGDDDVPGTVTFGIDGVVPEPDPSDGDLVPFVVLLPDDPTVVLVPVDPAVVLEPDDPAVVLVPVDPAVVLLPDDTVVCDFVVAPADTVGTLVVVPD